MNEGVKLLESKTIVRFSDCDPFNHLNNSKYIDYFLNAREDQLLEFYNFNVYLHSQKTGAGWVVVQHEIAYFKPAFTSETVVLQSQILTWGEKEILVEFKMWDENKNKLKCLMWSKFYYFNLLTQKSEPHSEELNSRFMHLEEKVEGMESFESRVAVLRRKN
ncbi:MAG: acyl-CoA thioesterase [Chitinophagales bacterium]